MLSATTHPAIEATMPPEGCPLPGAGDTARPLRAKEARRAARKRAIAHAQQLERLLSKDLHRLADALGVSTHRRTLGGAKVTLFRIELIQSLRRQILSESLFVSRLDRFSDIAKNCRLKPASASGKARAPSPPVLTALHRADRMLRRGSAQDAAAEYLRRATAGSEQLLPLLSGFRPALRAVIQLAVERMRQIRGEREKKQSPKNGYPGSETTDGVVATFELKEGNFDAS